MTQTQRKRRRERKSNPKAKERHRIASEPAAIESLPAASAPRTKEERYAADVDILFAQFSELF